MIVEQQPLLNKEVGGPDCPPPPGNHHINLRQEPTGKGLAPEPTLPLEFLSVRVFGFKEEIMLFHFKAGLWKGSPSRLPVAISKSESPGKTPLLPKSPHLQVA